VYRLPGTLGWGALSLEASFGVAQLALVVITCSVTLLLAKLFAVWVRKRLRGRAWLAVLAVCPRLAVPLNVAVSFGVSLALVVSLLFSVCACLCLSPQLSRPPRPTVSLRTCVTLAVTLAVTLGVTLGVTRGVPLGVSTTRVP
jgi:hypothetical protein